MSVGSYLHMVTDTFIHNSSNVTTVTDTYTNNSGDLYTSRVNIYICSDINI